MKLIAKLIIKFYKLLQKGIFILEWMHIFLIIWWGDKKNIDGWSHPPKHIATCVSVVRKNIIKIILYLVIIIKNQNTNIEDN